MEDIAATASQPGAPGLGTMDGAALRFEDWGDLGSKPHGMVNIVDASGRTCEEIRAALRCGRCPVHVSNQRRHTQGKRRMLGRKTFTG